jgi:hypothetical protein
VRLRRTDYELGADHDRILVNLKAPASEVDVLDAESDRFSPPKTGIGEQSDERPVSARFDRERLDLFVGEVDVPPTGVSAEVADAAGKGRTMNLFILDTRERNPKYRGGLVCVIGSSTPTVEEKNACVELVARYAMDGWAIAADPHTLIGRLVARTACAAGAPFVLMGRVPERVAVDRPAPERGWPALGWLSSAFRRPLAQTDTRKGCFGWPVQEANLCRARRRKHRSRAALGAAFPRQRRRGPTQVAYRSPCACDMWRSPRERLGYFK